MSPYLIGFSGLATVGKTTAAKALANHLRNKGYDVEVWSMDGPIRSGLSCFGVTKDLNPQLYRHLAQVVGASCRKENPNWWVNVAKNNLDILEKHPSMEVRPDIIIFDDIRYLNEVKLIESHGMNVFIYSGGRVNTENPMYLHESEEMALRFEDERKLAGDGHILPVDQVLNNSGNLDRFYQLIETLGDQIATARTR